MLLTRGSSLSLQTPLSLERARRALIVSVCVSVVMCKTVDRGVAVMDSNQFHTCPVMKPGALSCSSTLPQFDSRPTTRP